MIIKQFDVSPKVITTGSEVAITFEMVVGDEGWPVNQWVDLSLPAKGWPPPNIAERYQERFSCIMNMSIEVLNDELDPYNMFCHVWYHGDPMYHLGMKPTIEPVPPGTVVRLTYGYTESSAPPVIAQPNQGEITFSLRKGFSLFGPMEEMHSAKVKIVPGEPKSVELMVPTLVEQGGKVSAVIRVFDQCRNLASRPLQTVFELSGPLDPSPVEAWMSTTDGNVRALEVSPLRAGPHFFSLKDKNHNGLDSAEAVSYVYDYRHKRTSMRFFSFDPLGRSLHEPYKKRSETTDLGVLVARSNPVKVVAEKPNYHIYWGDIHGHTDLSLCGSRPIEQCYSYARDEVGLDIAAMTDHEVGYDPEMWNEVCAAAEEFYRPASFVTLVGFEWTSKVYGHRNVYYPGANPPVLPYRYPKYPEEEWKHVHWSMTPDELYRSLDGIDCLIIPHHSLAIMDWNYSDERERLVEVYSGWGRSEFVGNRYWERRTGGGGAQAGLALGHRYGFIGGSDDHTGGPGRCRSWPEGLNIGHRSGLMAVLAPELTREAIYEALMARRCYATTGERMYLDFRVDGSPMGSEVIANGDVSIHAEVAGTDRIRLVEVLKNNKVIHSVEGDSELEELVLTDLPRGEGYEGEDWYYLRVTQHDGNMAWSSTIWVQPDQYPVTTRIGSKSYETAE
ncbi:MAG: CehA/McbA family metallohydrolase [Chloroflexota bacterium]